MKIRKTCLLFVIAMLNAALLGAALINSVSTQEEWGTFATEPEIVTAKVDDYFIVSVNCYDVIDLYGWQVEMNWTPLAINVTEIIWGDFLADQPEGTFRSKRIENDDGWLLVAETTIGEYSGVSGDGWLVSLKFLVITGEETGLQIDNDLTYYMDQFKQKHHPLKLDGKYIPPWPEDFNADGWIDIFDLATVAINFGKTREESNPPEADVNGDGVVDVQDLSLVAKKFGHYAN